MERQRKPFEGITNIIRFNWHFYVLSLAVACLLLLVKSYVSGYGKQAVLVMLLLLIISTFFSLIVSFYVYDVSALYSLNWLPYSPSTKELNIVNINAGFDETSYLLAHKYPAAKLTVFDFYDPAKHTEVSIARARKRYAPYMNTISIQTSQIPLQESSIDFVFTLLSAHEIRDRNERIVFFKELKKALKDNGTIIVSEHIRDLPNFIAYNIGVFHFYSKKEWKQTFAESGLRIKKERTVTPFIHVFFLQKNEPLSAS